MHGELRGTELREGGRPGGAQLPAMNVGSLGADYHHAIRGRRDLKTDSNCPINLLLRSLRD